jgi:hypothetical protein
LTAMNAGTFDYLAYPPVPGDLPRTIHHALTTRAGRNSQDVNSKFLADKGK